MIIRLCILFALLTCFNTAWSKELPMAVKIVACESAGQANVWGDDGTSFGIAQFQQRTFNSFKKSMGISQLNWKDPIHQLVLLNWALRNNLGHHWTCYRMIKSGKFHVTPLMEKKMRSNKYIRLMYNV
jgi:hypothetical protein